MMTTTGFKSVDEYIATHPEDVQAILQLAAGAFAALGIGEHDIDRIDAGGGDKDGRCNQWVDLG